jgi:L-threonylcarbamoyladenylate synthase
LPKAAGIRSRARSARSDTFTLADGIKALKSEELVVYPTETFYGLGADPFSHEALARLFAAKQREAGKPVGLIAADADSAFAVAREVPPIARTLADAFWPGPLTIVMPARAGIAAELLGADGGVAVRVSPHPVARALAEGLGHPVTATSANRSGEPPAVTLAQARAAFGAKVKVYLEGGRLGAAAPSTVISVVGADWRVLRTGAISERDIAAALAPGALK